MPWKTFLENARHVVHNILVSHKKTDNLLTIRTHKTKRDGKVYMNIGIAARGQLHKETVYGKRKAPGEEDYTFHVRKPVESLTTRKQIEKIVDPVIRNLILNRVENLGGFEKGDKVPQGTFFSIAEDGNKLPQIFLPNKKGDPVPVKKVRMRENIGGAEQLKESINQYVNPRNNHHVLIYKNAHGELREEVVTFWTAVERKNEGIDVFQLPEDGAEIVTTLQINDMFLLGLIEDDIDWENTNNSYLKDHLFRVQKFTSGDYYFRKHGESNLEGKLGKAFEYIKGFGKGKTGWQTFNPIKVRITSTGCIQKIY